MKCEPGAQPSRIVFVNRFYWPCASATSQLLHDLAKQIAACGVEVAVITSRHVHGGGGSLLPAAECHDGVRIVRARSSRFGGASLAGKAFDYLTFLVSALARLAWRTRSTDTVVLMTDPPMLAALAIFLLRLRSVRSVCWLQDVFPEVAIQLGLVQPSLLSRTLQALRDRSLRVVGETVVIGDAMARIVTDSSGVSPLVIPNWALDEARGDGTAFRLEWNLSARFVVGYSGNLGRVHRLEGLVDAAALLESDDRIRILFVGEGASKAGLQERSRRNGTANVCFYPPQPRSVLSDCLAVPDIHVVSMDPRVEGLVLPSKFVGIIASGKPVLCLADPSGELASLVADWQCGLVCSPDDAEGIARAIRNLADDPQLLSRLAHGAQQLWAARFKRRQAIQKWLAVLDVQCSDIELRNS